MNDKINLTYNTPGLGQLNAQLFASSSRVYKVLHDKGHIQRLKEINQLGVLRNAYEGAHHSRWEYVMIQLGILHRLNTIDFDLGFKPSKSTGLSTNMQIGNLKISHTEIIQIWILLFNIGHLPGTFSSEKALLKCIVNDKKLNNSLKSGLKDKKIKQFLDEQVNNFDIYNFHKVLSFFHLNRYKNSDEEIINASIEIFKYYCIGAESLDKFEKYSPDKQHEFEVTRNKLVGIYRRIRQVSYIYLDSKYGPVPFEFDLPSILIDLKKYMDEYFTENDQNFIQTMDSFDDFLSKSIYQSDYSLQFHAYHVKKITKLIYRKCADEEIYGIRNFKKFLDDGANFKLDHNYITDLENVPKISFTFNIASILGIVFDNGYKDYFTYDFEDILNSDYGDQKCLVSIETNIKQRYYTMFISFLKKCTPSQQYIILGKLIRDIVSIQKYFEDNEIFAYPDDFECIYSNLIEFCLNIISQEECSFKYDTRNSLDQPFIGNTGSKKMAGLLKKSIDSNKCTSSSRKHELESTVEALNSINHRGPIIISTNQIEVFDRQRDPLTDIDGIGLCYKGGKLYLLMVEAKNQKSGSAKDSQKQLRTNIIEKLKLDTSFKESIDSKIIKRNKFAYCFIPIDGK